MPQTDPAIAIVGANGQVGTELSILLRHRDTTVIPIVRNQIAAATFEHHGFEYRVGDVTDDAEARSLLAGADAVVVAAFAPWFGGPRPRIARRINEALVRNSARCAPEGAPVVHFSSLVAFGSDIGLSDWHWYGRTKRHLESVLEEASRHSGRGWYNLRLGHVYGPGQYHTRQFVENLRGRERVHLPVEPDKPTNVVHTVTVAEAIVRCANEEPDPGTFGVVNRPQWTWEDLVAQYLPRTPLSFSPERGDGERGGVGRAAVRNALVRFLGTLEPYQELLMPLLLYMPDVASTYLNHTRVADQAKSAIDRYEERVTYRHRHFNYDPIPGPFIDVSPAVDRLSDESYVCDTLDIPDNREAL